MKAIILAALMGVTTSFAAQADTLTLSTAMAGGTIHTDIVDMSVYWTASEDAFEVVAYYVSRNDVSTPHKLQMRLADGEHVVFGLPGQADAVYSFERNAGTLTVIAEPVQTDLASN